MLLRYMTTALLFVISAANLIWDETAYSYDHLVYQAQRKLKELGYDPGRTDGIFGEKTKAAVRYFQRDNGLPVSGRLDKQTIAMLSALKPPAKLYLTQAVKENDIHKVKALLAVGANVNGRNRFGEMPLHVAAIRGHRAILELLIDEGADVNAENKRGLTPLHAAAWGGHKEIVNMLIAEDADVNARDEYGVSALHVAALAGRKDTVAVLIVNGANINATNEGGMTPLHAAVLTGQKETGALLVAKGADVDFKNDDGLTPLDVASQKGYEAIVEMLRAHNAQK
jgi:ankyrin repeat protein